MGRLKLRLYREAVEEAREARHWYQLRDPEVAVKFLRELRLAILAVSEAPYQWPLHRFGCRRRRLRRFPYMVVYRIHGDLIEVVAVAHSRRRAGYWRYRKFES